MSARNQPPPQLEKSFSFNYGTLNSVLKILAVNSIFLKSVNMVKIQVAKYLPMRVKCADTL